MAKARKKEEVIDYNQEIFDALKLMSDESGIPEDYLAEKIKSAIIVAAKKDHRFIVDRQQLLGSDLCERIQPGAGASRQNNSFHVNLSSLICASGVCRHI